MFELKLRMSHEWQGKIIPLNGSAEVVKKFFTRIQWIYTNFLPLRKD